MQNIETASVALITTNPGGSQYEAPAFSLTAGSAYLNESWKGNPPGQEKLQLQVRRMCELIGTRPSNILSGYFVPFRSRNWDELPQKDESIEIAKNIWTDILGHSPAQMIFAFGKEIAPYLAPVLHAKKDNQILAGWGNQTTDLYSNGSRRLIVMPHLSRFGLFNRPASEAGFLKAIRGSNSAPV